MDPGVRCAISVIGVAFAGAMSGMGEAFAVQCPVLTWCMSRPGRHAAAPAAIRSVVCLAHARIRMRYLRVSAKHTCAQLYALEVRLCMRKPSLNPSSRLSQSLTSLSERSSPSRLRQSAGSSRCTFSTLFSTPAAGRGLRAGVCRRRRSLTCALQWRLAFSRSSCRCAASKVGMRGWRAEGEGWRLRFEC